MNQADLHRNLLRIVLYAAGVVILVLAIPALVALIVTAAAMVSGPGRHPAGAEFELPVIDGPPASAAGGRAGKRRIG